MLFKSVASVLAVAGLAAAQSTTANYTHGVAHIEMDNINATFTFDKVATGMNVTVAVTSGLTTTLQIVPAGFEYHVHVYPVGAGNNCTATGGHLDPAALGTVSYKCDPSNVTTCQAGDLSGKHGNLVAENDNPGNLPTIQYVDTQLSYTGTGAMVGRSVVIHNNGTRIACADLVVDGYVATNSSTSTTSAAGSSATTTVAKPNSAAKLAGSVVLSGVVALMMMAL
ncbi:superoxide dismutase [Dissophora ornata]|nr:hypothetical protein BGZ58_006500 [Dissophora ornata]KAI8599953.1 superoxide dismutase [Dissophora ornata]